ncbi:MAG: DNA polymerase III subunit delta [Bacteroidales bacterium]|nr:DNA polymerase III subunit delta [Bacteroidales bacterium]
MAKTEGQTYKQILESIKKHDLAPLYLLTGEEAYYIDLLTKSFEQDILDENDKAFNMDVVYGKDATGGMLVGMCRQYPLMSEKRLVILKEAQMLDKKHWKDLALYLEKPLDSTIFVICNKKSTFDVKTKNLIVKNGGVVFKSDPISDYKLNDWISAYIKDKGYTCEIEVPAILADFLGNDLEKIDNELSKMFINLGERKQIKKEDVFEYVGVSKSYNVFELQKALMRKDVLLANKIVDYFSKNPKDNPPQVVIPMLFSFFAKVLAVSQLSDKSPQNVAAAIGGSPYFAKDYISATNYYSMPQLFAIIGLFEQYDLKSKGVDVSPLATHGDLYKELVFKILHV